MTETACPGSCNNPYREARAAYDRALDAYDPLDAGQSRPEQPSLIPWPGDPVWCDRCAPKIRLRLAELDDLIALRKATADGYGESSAAERVTGSQSGRSQSPAGDDEDDLASMLLGWERAYRDIKGWPSPPPRGELASAVTACIAWLMQHLDGILRSALADDFGDEVLRWHRELTGASKAGVRTLRKPMRCPSCQLLTLTWTEGETEVSCSNPDCRRVLLLADYDAEVERLAKEHQDAA